MHILNISHCKFVANSPSTYWPVYRQIRIDNKIQLLLYQSYLQVFRRSKTNIRFGNHLIVYPKDRPVDAKGSKVTKNFLTIYGTGGSR